MSSLNIEIENTRYEKQIDSKTKKDERNSKHK